MSAIRYAHRHGVVMTAVAGNGARAAVLPYPGRARDVIAVAATTEHGCRAAYSNSGAEVDVAAPGGGRDAPAAEQPLGSRPLCSRGRGPLGVPADLRAGPGALRAAVRVLRHVDGDAARGGARSADHRARGAWGGIRPRTQCSDSSSAPRGTSAPRVSTPPTVTAWSTPQPLSADVLAEAYYGERYRLMERLGAGGMAVVYRACDERLKRDVAIKVIARGFRQDVVAVRRFRREAELGALLTHPNIVSVLGAGADPHDFIVMELVRGHDVRALVKERGRQPLQAVLDVLAQIARWAAVHARSRRRPRRRLSGQRLDRGRRRHGKARRFRLGPCARGHVGGPPGARARDARVHRTRDPRGQRTVTAVGPVLARGGRLLAPHGPRLGSNPRPERDRAGHPRGSPADAACDCPAGSAACA